MHRSTGSSSNGGLFKGGIFGSPRSKSQTRPSTSSGSPSTHSEPTFTTSTPPSRSSTTFSRKPSFTSTQKSPKSAGLRHRTSASIISGFSPERRTNSSATHYIDNYPLPERGGRRQPGQVVEQPRSADILKQVVESTVERPHSRTDSFTSTTPYARMLARPSTGYQTTGSNNGGAPSFAPLQPPSPTLETITYQHIQDTSSKRISTLDYLRKA